MYRALTILAPLLIFPISANASETRLGAGFGYGDCTGSDAECSSQEFFRLSIAQKLSPQLSIDLVGDLKPFNSGERFNSYGINLKYAFSPLPNSAYISVGPHYYERREFTSGSFGSQSRSGVGLSTALGWQNSPESRLGYGAEVWYRTLDDFNAYGVSLFVTYGFNIF